LRNEVIQSHSFAIIPKTLTVFEKLIQKHLVLDLDPNFPPQPFYEETEFYWIVPRYFPAYMSKLYKLNLSIQYHTIEPQEIELNVLLNQEMKNKNVLLAF